MNVVCNQWVRQTRHMTWSSAFFFFLSFIILIKFIQWGKLFLPTGYVPDVTPTRSSNSSAVVTFKGYHALSSVIRMPTPL